MTSPEFEQSPSQQRRELERKTGLDLSIPQVFRDYGNRGLPPTVTVNTLTGLPIEDGLIAEHMAERLSKAVRKGNKWVFSLSDVDNLKYINDALHNRPLGDIVIKYGAAKAAQAAGSALVIDGGFREGVDAVALRAGDRADETIVAIFGANDNEIERFRTTIYQTSAPITVTDENVSFSISTAVLSSDNPNLYAILERELPWIQEGNTSYRLYGHIMDLLKEDIGKQKNEKDLQRIAARELLHIDKLRTLIRLASEILGGSRISPELLAAYADLVAITTVRELGKHPLFNSSYPTLLSELGLSEEQLRALDTASEIHEAFQKFFPADEEGPEIEQRLRRRKP